MDVRIDKTGHEQIIAAVFLDRYIRWQLRPHLAGGAKMRNLAARHYHYGVRLITHSRLEADHKRVIDIGERRTAQGERFSGNIGAHELSVYKKWG